MNSPFFNINNMNKYYIYITIIMSILIDVNNIYYINISFFLKI